MVFVCLCSVESAAEVEELREILKDLKAEKKKLQEDIKHLEEATSEAKEEKDTTKKVWWTGQRPTC